MDGFKGPATSGGEAGRLYVSEIGPHLHAVDVCITRLISSSKEHHVPTDPDDLSRPALPRLFVFLCR